MRYLHDRSALAYHLLPPAASDAPASAVDPLERELWRAIEGPAEVAACGPADRPAGFWSCLAIVESASSSQFDALASALGHGLDLPRPVAIIAGVCPRFHGFHDRAWKSCPGNLHFTAVVPRTHLDARSSAGLSVLPALAARDAILEASGGLAVPQIKWINDLYLGPGKVAGALMRSHVQRAAIELALLGIGINVATAPALERTPFVPCSARVSGIGLGPLLQALLAALARRFEKLRTDGPAPLIAAYRAASLVVGRRVRVYRDSFDDLCSPDTWPRPVAAGVVAAVGDDLSLIIEGRETPVIDGRLAFEEDCVAYGLAPM